MKLQKAYKSFRRIVGFAIGILVLLFLLQSDRFVEASRPGELARYIPQTPLALFEADDLPGLVANWRDCDLRRDLSKTNVFRRCESTRIVLRLGHNLDLLDAAFSESTTLDRLANLPGNKGAIALYNVSNTTFVMWLRTHHGAGADLEILNNRVDIRRQERGGQVYFVHQGSETSSQVAYAVVGDLLIVSNDLERFEQSLTLALDGGGGGSGESLASDQTYQELVRRSPQSAQAHIFLDMERLLTIRPFRRHWIHNNADELTGLDKVMLSVTFEENETVEHRVHSYTSPGASSRIPTGPVKGSDHPARLKSLLRGTYTSLSAVDADSAAFAARWIWPGASDGGPALDELRELLGRGQPKQMVEVVRLLRLRDGFTPRDTLGVSFLLDNPRGLSTDAFFKSATNALSRSVLRGRKVVLPTKESLRWGVTARMVTTPLPGGPSVAVARSSDRSVLTLATTAHLASELTAAAAPTGDLGGQMGTTGPNVTRVSYEYVRRILGGRLSFITRSHPTYTSDFWGSDVPEILNVPQITTIEKASYRDGDFDIHEIRYVQ